MRRRVILSLLALVSAVALAGVLVWPWPAPEVDWRTPVDRALVARDCKTAVVIAEAAAGAGSADAYKMLRGLIKGGTCNGYTDEHAGNYYAFVSAYRSTGASADEVYGLSDNDLGFWRHSTASAVLFLCASPYSGLRHVDNVALSDAVPESRGPVMAWHRFRRQTCIGVLARLARQLVEADDRPANEVAFALLHFPPGSEARQAGFLFARLLLEKKFVPHFLRDNEAAARHMRDLAWFRLEKAAEADNADAIRLMVALLHEGRLRARDDAAAYFWILRQRRLGLTGAPLDIEIERALSDAERASVRLREEEKWRWRSGDIIADPAF
jgi:hypothetical protein